MQFRRINARPNWQELSKKLGYLSSIFDNPPYWIEALPEPFCAVFSEAEIDMIEAATASLTELAWHAVEHICNGSDSERLLNRLKVPEQYHGAIRASWNRGDRSLFGRYDFSYGDGQLKLLEMNFDGAVSLYEASVFQWIWLEDLRRAGQLPSNAYQFNLIHEHLIRAFQSLKLGDSILHFASLNDATEEEETVRYLQSCSLQANLASKFLYMKDIGYDTDGRLVDPDNTAITTLFKLYPWELLFEEDSVISNKIGKSILIPLIENGKTNFIEPVWKCLLSNKGILSILHELEPDNPLLLQAAFEDDEKAERIREKPHVRKPIFGREGQNVAIVYPGKPEESIVSPGHYGAEGFVLQELHPLPKYDKFHILIGSWIVEHKPVGVGIRADMSPITTASRCLFVPHAIEP